MARLLKRTEPGDPLKATFIRHVAFEDAGTLAEVLEQEGFRTEYVDAGDVHGMDPHDAGLLVVLGGPISVNDEEDFPFLMHEKALLAARLEADLPTLGICLGAQLMAAALGARVFRGPRKEIGWSPLALSRQGQDTALRHLEGVSVLHWHGETFELPPGAAALASTADYPNQAFSWGRRALALQFHPEVTVQGLERWFIGHINEITSTPGLSIPLLRRETRLYGPALRPQATALWRMWLKHVSPLSPLTQKDSIHAQRI